MEEFRDEEIAVLVQSGKVDSFGILINRYEKKLSRYAYKFLSQRQDIEDIVQDIFLKAYKNIQSFDSKRKFSSWLYRIAHNELVNALKKKKRNSLLFFDLDTFVPHFSYDKNEFIDKIDNEKMKEKINNYLDKLEPKYREPIILYYYEEFDYKEIADILKIPVSTVGVRIKRGRDKLKNFLNNE